MDQSQDPNFGGAGVRRHITNFNAFDNYQYSLLKLGSQPSLHSRPILHPHFNYYRYQSLPKANESNPADGICSHYLLHGFNRIGRAPITVAQFSPDAQRLILGTEGGDFTLW